MIYTIDENDDWKDENCWIKGNPNLGISVKLDDLRRKAKKAKEIVSAQNNFLRKHLNVWVQQSTRWIDIDVWNSNYHHIINEERLRGRQFFGGLDLSSVSDLTAWVMVFPDPEIFEKVDVVSRFWCPESALSNRKNRYRNYYETWYREGLLKITPGDAIDYKYIKSQILEDIRKFDLIDMAVDRLFQGYQLCTELSQALGQHYVDGELQDKVIAVTPNGTMMTPALKELELRLLNKKINHGNNPILKWMADNLAIRETATGLRMPDKAESQGKIDGIVALLMALDRLMRHPVTIQSGSKYEREGLAVV
jgi:phage terminase large subunit-like protein